MWLLSTSESGRAVKTNDDGEVKANADSWNSGCQGVLVDSKTVVTTSDCALNMPHTCKLEK